MPNECWQDYSNWSAIFANHDLPGLSSWRLEKFQQTEANQNLPSIHHDGRKANISIATILIESSCVRDLDLDRIIDVFAAEKTHRKTF